MPKFKLAWPFHHGRHHPDGSVTITKGVAGDIVELTDEEAKAVNSAVLQPVDPAEKLASMTAKELRAQADALGIDLGDASKKSDIIAAIENAENPEE